MATPQRWRGRATAERIELVVSFAGVLRCYPRQSCVRGPALPDLWLARTLAAGRKSRPPPLWVPPTSTPTMYRLGESLITSQLYENIWDINGGSFSHPNLRRQHTVSGFAPVCARYSVALSGGGGTPPHIIRIKKHSRLSQCTVCALSNVLVGKRRFLPPAHDPSPKIL